MARNDAPLVTVICPVYNQRDYVKETLDSILSQKTNFPFEILVHDDASTDGTQQVLLDYQRCHPKIIRLVLQVENQLSLGRRILSPLILGCDTEFIAFCEGDDYWIDDEKLQKQVDYLRANADIVLTGHRWFKKLLDGCVFPDDLADYFDGEKTKIVSLINYMRPYCIKTNAALFRRSAYQGYRKKSGRDFVLWAEILRNGNAAVLPDIMSVYRMNNQSMYSSLHSIKKINMDWEDFSALAANHGPLRKWIFPYLIRIGMKRIIYNIYYSSPQWVQNRAARLKKYFLRSVESYQRKKGQVCPLCGKTNVAFLPLDRIYDEMLDQHGYIHSIFQTETMNRRAYSCANCGGSDRDRLYAIYLNSYLRDGGKMGRLLDIAPFRPLTAFIKAIGPLEYKTADLNADTVDDVVDIQDMKIYPDGRFEHFICSHVLEHVPNDVTAMAELFRVTAQGGWGICMVPINCALSEIYENDQIVTEADRWKHFGHGDHYRIYSPTGFARRLESVGFRVNKHGIEYFGEDVFRKHGIHPRSALYIAHKD